MAVASPRESSAPTADVESRNRSPSAAPWILAAVLVCALPLYLVLAHNQWFFLDEWDFLATRHAGSLDDLFRPHNEHWSTLPILEYRALFGLFGLRSYVPYQLVTVVAHLVVAALLWLVMRRAGVDSWIATAAAALFALLGSGHEDVVWAFQIGFTGALAFGLGQLLLADHDGPIGRRDVAGLACGLAALLCSGIGVSMVAAVGVAVLVRRGWRAAAFQVLPLAVAFAVWWLVAARDDYGAARLDLAEMAIFARRAITHAFAEMGGLPGVGVGLAVVLVAGIALAVRARPSEATRRRLAAPLALLFAGAGSFLLVIATGRSASFGDGPDTSRYVHVLSAMSLPAVAVAADALARRWRAVLPVLVALFLVAIPGNIRDLTARDEGAGAFALGAPQLVRTLPVLPDARQVPADLRVDRKLPGVTIGWLRSLVRSGDLQPLRRPPSLVVAQARIRLVLGQRSSEVRRRQCRTLERPMTRMLRAGERFTLHDGVLVVASDRSAFVRTTFAPADGTELDVVLPRRVTLSSATADRPAVVCFGRIER